MRLLPAIASYKPRRQRRTWPRKSKSGQSRPNWTDIRTRHKNLPQKARACAPTTTLRRERDPIQWSTRKRLNSVCFLSWSTKSQHIFLSACAVAVWSNGDCVAHGLCLLFLSSFNFNEGYRDRAVGTNHIPDNGSRRKRTNTCRVLHALCVRSQELFNNALTSPPSW